MRIIRRMTGDRSSRFALLLLTICTGFLGCSSGGSSGNPPPPPAPPPPVVDITIGGVISDGPVLGGTVFAFAADQVLPALASVDPNGDRLAALSAANSVATLARDEVDEDQFSIDIPGDMAGDALFLIFDNADAEDEQFRDVPPNLHTVIILGDAGSTQQLNMSLHTTLVTDLVLRELDPDGDGTPIDAAAIQSAVDTALLNILPAFMTDTLGQDRYPADFDPFAVDDDDTVHQASSAIGFLLRTSAIATGLTFDQVTRALAGDAADGVIDGSIPLILAPTLEEETAALAVSAIVSAGSDEDLAALAVGPCSSATVALRQACAVDVIDDLFELTAICTDILDDDERTDCLAAAAADSVENNEECNDVFDARLDLCADVDDSAHDPMFGGLFAANFVDPLQIGATVPVNPWFPLVTGNRWVYEGGDEVIEVEVTDETKLIDGVTCVVVVDTASEDAEVVEITRDWYAQDIDGNVWYCGEIARNFETFDGDDPEDAELVDIDGSWKAGRDGAEPGILLPFSPVEGDVIRQEVLFGEAEDVVEILSLSATESSAGGACSGDCLMTADTTPLEPDVEENKFYAPGIGLIVEVDLETGDRVELTEFTSL